MRGSEQVFDWLAASGIPTIYLHPLNLVWGKDGAEADLAQFSLVAGLLEQHPDYWRSLFRCGAWREQLIATTCALVGRKGIFCEEFQNAIHGGSWIGPQLVVAFSLLHPSEAKEWLMARWHGEMSTKPLRRLKDLGAIREVLMHRVPELVSDPFETATLSPMDLDDWLVGCSVASKHWRFWQPRLDKDS